MSAKSAWMTAGVLLLAIVGTLFCSCSEEPSNPRDSEPPTAIDDLVVADTSATAATLEWTAPKDPPSQCRASTYEIRYWGEGGGWEDATSATEPPQPAAPDSVERFTVEALQPETEYFFQIQSKDARGNGSALSNVALARTGPPLDTEAPSAITTLEVVTTTESELALRWIAPSDPPRGTASYLYELRFWTYGEEWATGVIAMGLPAPAAPGTQQRFVIGQLAPVMSYHVQMRSRDREGNWSDLSNEVFGRTRPAAAVCPPVSFLSEILERPRPFLPGPEEWLWRRSAVRKAMVDSCPPNPDAAFCPYGADAWHPSGIIGFNYIPVREMTWPWGLDCMALYHQLTSLAGYWLMDADGSNQRRVLPARLGAPSWSPDGDWIVFYAGGHIYSMPFLGEGFDQSRIVHLACDGGSATPMWSPDGTKIAFENWTSADGWCVYVVNPDGTGLRRIRRGAQYPAWNPDGEHLICISGHMELCEVSIYDTSDVVFHTNYGGTVILRSPLYAPTGDRIVFLLDSIGSGLHIWVVEPGGGAPRLLCPDEVGQTQFGRGLNSWSPDGTRLIYQRYDANEWTYENGTLWTVDVTTGATRQLTFNPYSGP
jgi:Tol biopolymer transport system component